MCGIVGFYHAARSADSFPETISQMLALIRHRGPDEMGYYFDERVALGTARLSIIDLASGQQPLSDPSGRYWISYNGEIYNYLELRQELTTLGYEFTTYSDTEVLLAAYIVWGRAAFAKLNGGFAFALYDRHEDSLLLVRDRYGKRPLYYTQCGQEWIFASELKCFVGHGGVTLTFDPAQLASILTLWTPLPEQSGYCQIQQAPEGGFVSLRADGTATIGRYYALDFQGVEHSVPLSEDEAIAQTSAALAESVRLRLRSDVEVGAYLSGGLDSTITTLLATQSSPYPVRTFSISFEDAAYDESADQAAMSQHLGTIHSTLRITDRDLTAAFPAALWHAEVPVFRTAFVPMYLLAQQVQAAGIKVVLTGEGADESFLGYDLFKETLLRLHWAQLASPQEKQARLAALYPYQSHFQSNAAALVSVFDQFITEQEAGLFSHEIRFSNSRYSTRLLAPPVAEPFAAMHAFLAARSAEFMPLDPLQRAQWLEFKTLLAGYLLSSQGDRMSFAHGVETRMPFLDPNVVHFAWQLPTDLKLKGGVDEKYILKRAFADQLPTRILQKPKQPYRAPDAPAFFAADPPAYLELIYATAELKKLQFIDVTFAQRFVEKLRQTPKTRISQRENQTFIFLLSLALLQHQWRDLPSQCPAAENIADILVRRIDGRQATNGSKETR